MRLVFFGTPQPAVVALEALLASRHEVAAVVTAPDRPKGRGMQVEPSPVASAALGHGLTVMRPQSLKDPAHAGPLTGFSADAFVVVAYGAILKPHILEIPRVGCYNLHFSLLPQLRGAAPVQWALLEGHTVTGVTVIKMDEGMDTGPMLAQVEEPILPDDTAGELEGRLAVKGAALLTDVMDLLQEDSAAPHPQAEELATYAPKISPRDSHIDWSLDAASIINRVRAFDPRPGAWGLLNSKRLKIWRATIMSEPSTMPPGTIDVGALQTLIVETGTFRVSLDEVQPEGRSRMSAAEFVRGYRPMIGDAIT